MRGQTDGRVRIVNSNTAEIEIHVVLNGYSQTKYVNEKDDNKYTLY